MLSGKVAIVTGASRGIGRAIALKFASSGAAVAAVYANDAAGAESLVETCCGMGVKSAAYRCDVSDFECVKETVARIKSDFGTVHILVNNAGITCDKLLAVMSEQDFDKVLDTNLKGAFNMIRHTIPVFMRSKEGCIINVSSVSGITGNAGQANYSASKAGLIGLTKSVAKEYASKNVRCNAIAPGFIATDMTSAIAEEQIKGYIPLGRMGDADDVALAAVYLAQAKYVTGAVLTVDGGIAM